MNAPTLSPQKRSVVEPLSSSRAKFRRFLEAVEMGTSDATAASISGIHRRTVIRWMQSDTPWGEVVRTRAYAARAVREQRLVEAINRSAFSTDPKVSDWRAAAWLLERTYPERYSKNSSLIVGSAPEEPVRIERSMTEQLATDRERAKQVLRILHNAGVGGALPDPDEQPTGHR